MKYNRYNQFSYMRDFEGDQIKSVNKFIHEKKKSQKITIFVQDAYCLIERMLQDNTSINLKIGSDTFEYQFDTDIHWDMACDYDYYEKGKPTYDKFFIFTNKDDSLISDDFIYSSWAKLIGEYEIDLTFENDWTWWSGNEEGNIIFNVGFRIFPNN